MEPAQPTKQDPAIPPSQQHSRVTASDGTALGIRVGGDHNGVPVLLLSGGPGCINYLPDALAGSGILSVAPDPRGVGSSAGEPHDLAREIDDLEDIRERLGLANWTVVGHSFGADLGLAYALEAPRSTNHLVSICGTGVQNDRDWRAAYQAGIEPQIDIHCDAAVHRRLLDSWRDWIKAPDLLSRLASLSVPTQFIIAGEDIRPSWPIEQLAHLTPGGHFQVIPDVPHDFWHTNPSVWFAMLAEAVSP